MDNIVQYNCDNVDVESVSKFSDFLKTDTVTQIRPTIRILPSIVKDILDTIIEVKKINVNNRQYNQKIDLANRVLDVQEEGIQARRKVELEKIHSDTRIKLREIESSYQIHLAQINADLEKELASINADEKVKLLTLKANYDLEKKKQDDMMARFKQEVDESNRRFNIQMKNIARQYRDMEKTRREISSTIKALNTKIINGTAQKEDYDIYKYLIQLKMNSYRDNFNITEELINIFQER